MKRALQVIEREDGSDLVEFALVMIPMFMFVFAIMCTAWFVFAKASLQHAVREGCRYAVTDFDTTDKSIPAIQQVVVQNAVGVPGLSTSQIQVQYLAQSNLNLVKVSVSNIRVNPLGPVGLGFSAITLSAAASDVMESH